MQKVVSHPSTNRAKHCLTSVVGRALLLPSLHGLCQDTKWKTGKEEMQSLVSQLWFLEAKSGIQCPGHPNKTIRSTLSSCCSGIFQNVASLYWEATSYHPTGLILRRGKLSQLQKRMKPGDLSAFGIQIGPIGAK